MPEKLYFEMTLIGDIESTESEFPSFNGNFTQTLVSTDQISNHIINYIDFSKRYTDFYMNEEEVPDDLEQKLLDEEEKYVDLINSNSWHIIDSTGVKTKILVPTFDSQNIINWRLNVE